MGCCGYVRFAGKPVHNLLRRLAGVAVELSVRCSQRLRRRLAPPMACPCDLLVMSMTLDSQLFFFTFAFFFAVAVLFRCQHREASLDFVDGRLERQSCVPKQTDVPVDRPPDISGRMAPVDVIDVYFLFVWFLFLFSGRSLRSCCESGSIRAANVLLLFFFRPSQSVGISVSSAAGPFRFDIVVFLLDFFSLPVVGHCVRDLSRTEGVHCQG